MLYVYGLFYSSLVELYCPTLTDAAGYECGKQPHCVPVVWFLVSFLFSPRLFKIWFQIFWGIFQNLSDPTI